MQRLRVRVPSFRLLEYLHRCSLGGQFDSAEVAQVGSPKITSTDWSGFPPLEDPNGTGLRSICVSIQVFVESQLISKEELSMKYKVLFKDWMAEKHVCAMKACLEDMSSVEILQREDDWYIIKVAEGMEHVIEDMNVCDYIMAVAAQDESADGKESNVF